MLIDVDWSGDTGFFDLGGDMWQLTPDGLGGFIAMPYDPLADLAAGFLMPLVFALPIAGMIMVGAPFVIALAAALLGLVAYVLLGSLVHPVTGFGVFSTCLVYALGTLSWAIMDMFETRNPVFLFGYIGLAAVILIVWAMLWSFAGEFEDASSVLAVIVSFGGFIASAILFFTAGGESRETYSVYAFRIMHYLVLACLVAGVVGKVISLSKKGSSTASFPMGGLVGCAAAFALGLVPLVGSSLLGAANGLVACGVFVGLYAAIVALTPSLGKDVKASPAWVLMPLLLGSCLYLVAENTPGFLISTEASRLIQDAVLENPLLVFLRQAVGGAASAFSGPVTSVCNGLADFVAGIFDNSWPDFPVASFVVIAFMLALAVAALMLGATLRTSLAKAGQAK